MWNISLAICFSLKNCTSYFAAAIVTILNIIFENNVSLQSLIYVTNQGKDSFLFGQSDARVNHPRFAFRDFPALQPVASLLSFDQFVALIAGVMINIFVTLVRQ